jgi:peptide deformylase
MNQTATKETPISPTASPSEGVADATPSMDVREGERQHMNFEVLDAAKKEHAIVFAKPEEVEGVVCEDVTIEDITPEHLDLTKRMLKLLAQINGLGLAAPQIGIKKKFFVYWDTRTNTPHCCYNAKYYGNRSTATWGERCLTYGQLMFAIKRYKSIQAVWYEYDPDKHELVKRTKSMSRLEAEVFQHETDHLNGETLATKGILIS